MYTTRFSSNKYYQTKTINKLIYGAHNKHILYTYRYSCIHIITKNTSINYHQYSLTHYHHNYNYNNTYFNQFYRSFATTKTPKKIDDDDLDLELEEEEVPEEPQSPARHWKRARSNIEMEKNESQKSTKWNMVKSTFTKPFTAVSSKFSRKKKKDDDDFTSIAKDKTKKIHRPNKKSLPQPNEGVLTHIPQHKAQILHILQEQCSIFPDEVFPLFPDKKTEEILADAEDWYGDGIQFVDTQETLKALDDGGSGSDDEHDSDDEKYIEDYKEKDQLLLDDTQIDRDSDDDDHDTDGLIVTGPTPLAKIETAQISKSDIDIHDKPVQKASKFRDQKVSGIIVDERTKFRELEWTNPFKYRRVMTPEMVQELYSGDNADKLQLKKTDYDDDYLAAYNSKLTEMTHRVWQQEPDNVYEIIQLLREIGFKTNQNSSIWPYTEFDIETDDAIETDAHTKELVISDGTTLNPLPDTFNDFFLLFSRFPEILTMEISDIRRKLHSLEQFQIEDIRSLLLKDPRVLRRPSHHTRMLLEIFDDFFIDDFSVIIELSPHFLASTSRKELLRRIIFIHCEILEPYNEYNVYRKDGEIDRELWYKNMQMQLKHLRKDSEYFIKNGNTIQNDDNISNEVINGIYLDDNDKHALSEFIIKHPDVIGNSNVNRMNQIKNLLKKLGIKGKKLNDLLYEYPQILTLSPKTLHECVNKIKLNGVRDYRQYLIDNIHDVLTHVCPVNPRIYNNDNKQQIEDVM